MCQSKHDAGVDGLVVGAAVVVGALPEGCNNVDDEASMQQDMVPFGCGFENEDEVAEALGLGAPAGQPAAAGAGGRGRKRNAPAQVIRDLAFEDTDIGADADDMDMSISCR